MSCVDAKTTLPLPEGEVAPHTSKPFLDDPQEFHFAIIPDRAGQERKGFFGDTMRALNLLRPEFTICVGDLIEGCYCFPNDRNATENTIHKQYKELKEYISTLDMRFFYVVGNHDINVGWPGNHLANEVTRKEWHERFGKHSYYDFMYKGCHFVCLDSLEGRDGRLPLQGITDEQYAWAKETILAHADARWTFVFMHMPIDWTSDKFIAFEKSIGSVNYTVFCGDWHNHIKAIRNGKNYYMIGTCGGCWDYGVTQEDLRYGIMDSITWVTVTADGPVVANLRLSGIFNDDIQRCATTKGWIETPLDYPDHLNMPDGLDAERMSADGYDWHFRHALILRNGDMLIKPDVVLAGDDIIHRWGGWDWVGDDAYQRPPELDTPFFNEHSVLNIGFAGDRCENLLWRIRHGELNKLHPTDVLLHIGTVNLRDGDTPITTAEKSLRVIQAIHTAVPMAKITILAPLETQVPGREEFNALMREIADSDGQVAFVDLSEAYLSGGTAALEAYFLPRLGKAE